MDTPSLPDHPHPPASAPACHGPYEDEPVGTFLAPARRTAMLHQALDGVTLGTWDTRILAWLCHWSDTPTFLAVLGMVERARATAQATHTPAGRDLVDRCQPLVRLAGVAGDFWNHAHTLLGTLERLAATDPDAAVLHAQTELLIEDYDQAKAAYDQAATARAGESGRC